jgi:hypothetical protein
MIHIPITGLLNLPRRNEQLLAYRSTGKGFGLVRKMFKFHRATQQGAGAELLK